MTYPLDTLRLRLAVDPAARSLRGAALALLAQGIGSGGEHQGEAQVTYPLDTLRLRLAVDPAARSLRGAALALLREGSYAAFFRGLGASMLGEALHATGLGCA